MSPEQVEKGSRACSTEVREQLLGQWLLSGIISKKMFANLKVHAKAGLPTQLTAFPTASGAAYAIVSCQLASHQCRVVLPLYDAKVVAFLPDVTKNPFNLRLSIEGHGNQSLIYKCSFQPDDIHAMVEMCVEMEWDKLDAFTTELPHFIREILNPSAVPNSLLPKNVLDVDVSVLMPVVAQG